MDPKLPPFVASTYERGPVDRFEVRHMQPSRTETVVETVPAEGQTPEDVARMIWDAAESDSVMVKIEAVYWVYAFRPGKSVHDRRMAMRFNGDKLAERGEQNPLLRMLDHAERRIADQDGHLIAMVGLFGKYTTEQLGQKDARIRDLEQRELDVMRLYFELHDKKDERALLLEREKRDARLFEKFEKWLMIWMGEIMGDKDGKLNPTVERQIMQDFVDSMSDEDVAGLLDHGTLTIPKDERRMQIMRMLQPYVETSLAKKRAKAQADAAAATAAAARGEVPPPQLQPAKDGAS